MSNRSSTIAIILVTIAVVITVIAMAACNSNSGEPYTLVTTSSVVTSYDDAMTEETSTAATVSVTVTTVSAATSASATASEVSETVVPEATRSTATPTEKPISAAAATTAPTNTKEPKAASSTTSTTKTVCNHDWRLWTEWEDCDEYKCSICGATMYKDKPEPTYTIPSPTPSPTPKPTETTIVIYKTGVDVAIHFWYCIDWDEWTCEERTYVVHNVDPDVCWPASDTQAEKALVAEYGLDPDMFAGIGSKSIIGAYFSDGSYVAYR